MDGEQGSEKISGVLKILRRQAPLTLNQANFCNRACVQRFLEAKGGSVKKAAKQLRACLSWRQSVGADNFTAGYSSSSSVVEDGIAYVAGNDDESRPVLIIRIKQTHRKCQAALKSFIRMLVFTIEPSIAKMPANVEQFVLLFDASSCGSASVLLNVLMPSLKLVAHYYPGRVHKAFVVDPPSLFTYLWMGIRPFVELSAPLFTVHSMDFDTSAELSDFSTPRRTPSTAEIGSCPSSRFTFTVSHHSDSLKPWHLSFSSDTSSAKVRPAISPLHVPSFSFARRAAADGGDSRRPVMDTRSSSIPLAEAFQRVHLHPTTPKPSFLKSPATFFSKKSIVSEAGKGCQEFLPYLQFYAQVPHKTKQRTTYV